MKSLLSAFNDSGSSMFDRLVLGSLYVLIVFLPIFFIPSPAFPFQLTKSALIAFFVLLGLIFFIVGRLQDRRVIVPYEHLFLAIWGIPFAYLLATFLGEKSTLSLVGERMSADTFAFMAFGALAVFLVISAARTKGKMLSMYIAFLGSFALLGLFHLVRLLVGGNALSFGVFADQSSGPFGILKELGMFFGLIAILSLVTLMGLRMTKQVKIVVTASLIVSLFFIMITNVSVVWWLVGLTALGTFVYNILNTGTYKKGGATEHTQEEHHEHEHAGESPDEADKEQMSNGAGMFGSLVVLAIAMVFVLGGGGLTSAIAGFFNVGQIDIRPSWQTTIAIGKNTLAENFLFGGGPESFPKQWALHRPVETNQTVVWNSDFNSGIGFIPTSFASTGVVGIIAWLVFLGFFVYTGLRTLLFARPGDSFTFYLSLSSFVGAAYLWILAFISNPNNILLFYAFLLTGLFIASLRYRPQGLKEINLSFVESPRLGFVTVLLLTIMVLGSVASLFAIGERYAAAAYYQRSFISLNRDANIDQSTNQLSQAITLDASDTYYRFAANLDLIQINQLLAENPEVTEEVRSRFQAYLARAIDSAGRATTADPSDYQNWVRQAQVYRAVVPLGIEGAYDSSKTAYERAIALRPESPAILFDQAQLEFLAGNRDSARELTTQALATRPTYSDAMFLLARIQIEEGNIDEAISSVENAVIITPNNPVALFQLGLLRYSNQDFAGAANAFNRAVELNEVYSNARYFLGLSQYWLDNVPAAIEQFERIEELNPENEEVQTILTNLRNGLEPFGAEPGTTPRSEPQPDLTTLNELPIEETDPQANDDAQTAIEEETIGEGGEAAPQTSTDETQPPPPTPAAEGTNVPTNAEVVPNQ